MGNTQQCLRQYPNYSYIPCPFLIFLRAIPMERGKRKKSAAAAAHQRGERLKAEKETNLGESLHSYMYSYRKEKEKISTYRFRN